MTRSLALSFTKFLANSTISLNWTIRPKLLKILLLLEFIRDTDCTDAKSGQTKNGWTFLLHPEDTSPFTSTTHQARKHTVGYHRNAKAQRKTIMWRDSHHRSWKILSYCVFVRIFIAYLLQKDSTAPRIACTINKKITHIMTGLTRDSNTIHVNHTCPLFLCVCSPTRTYISAYCW